MARSLEELALIQKQHEEEVETERLRREAEEQAERERRNEALEKLNRRYDLSGELLKSQKELNSIEDTNIQERITISESVKGDVLEKDSELESFQVEYKDIDDRISEIKKIIDGKKDIAPEVKEELDETKRAYNSLEQDIQEATKILDELKGKIVTDKEIQHYRDLVEKVYLLNTELKEIEKDSYVLDLMDEEEKIRDLMIKNISETVLGEIGKSDKKDKNFESAENINSRITFVKLTTGQFLKDEIESRQISVIKNREKRIDALRKLEKYVIMGYTNPDVKIIKFDKDQGKEEKSLVFAGVALAAITGKILHKNGILGILAMEINDDPKNSKPDKTLESVALKLHYKTLNILSAYKSEIGKYSYADKIIEHAKSFDSYTIKTEFPDMMVEKDGFMVPKNASNAEKNDARNIFEESKNSAYEEKEKMEQKITGQKQEELERLNKELATFKNNLERLKSEDNILKNTKISDINREEEKIKSILASKEDRLKVAKGEFDNTLVLNFAKRSTLETEIKDLENFIGSLDGTLKGLKIRKDNFLKSSDNLKKMKNELGSEIELQEKISRIEKIITELPKKS